MDFCEKCGFKNYTDTVMIHPCTKCDLNKKIVTEEKQNTVLCCPTCLNWRKAFNILKEQFKILHQMHKTKKEEKKIINECIKNINKNIENLSSDDITWGNDCCNLMYVGTKPEEK